MPSRYRPARSSAAPRGLYAYRVEPDDTVEVQPVEVEPFGDRVAVVTAGLNAGDRVVTAGQYRLQAGARVTIAANPTAKPVQTAEVTP